MLHQHHSTPNTRHQTVYRSARPNAFSLTLRTGLIVFAIAIGSTLGGTTAQAQLLDRNQTCNLARNAAFESVSLTPPEIHHWTLTADSGAGSLAILTHPLQPVQSGAHAARVIVTQPGNLYLASAEAGSGIGVLPNTEYQASVRLRSDSNPSSFVIGEPGRARLGIAEWSSPTGNPTVIILDEGTGNGSWTTLEGRFTTQPTTRFVSIRLIHSLEAGTFDWDDPMLARTRTDEVCIDLRHHRAQTTPGFKMCGPWFNHEGLQKHWCHDGEKSSLNEFVRTSALIAAPDNFDRGNFGVILHNGTIDFRLGVHKNLDMGAGSRCFANPGKLCGPGDGANALFPPHTIRMVSEWPVIDLGTVPPEAYNHGAVTAGAKLEHSWKDFDIRSFDPLTGTQSLEPIGNVNHRQWAFVAASIDFGGDLGIQENVLVIEEEQIRGDLDPTTFGGGKNLERYWFVRGWGRAGQTVWKSTACEANPGPSTCDGTYDTNPNGLLSFFLISPNDVDFSTIPPVAPFNIVDWWLR